MQDDLRPGNALLVNYLIDPAAGATWYVETLCQALVLLALLLAVPVRSSAAHPFGFALAALAVASSGGCRPTTATVSPTE